MRRFKVIALVCVIVSSMLFTACDVQTTGSVTEGTSSVVETGIVDETNDTIDSVPSNTTVTVSPTSNFSIHFIDVGQADAALIECDGHYMLIDGGNVADSNVVYSVLQRNNIDNLDIVVGTHAHEDHIGGLSGALEYATAKLVLSPVMDYDSTAFRNFRDYAEKQSNGLMVPEISDVYELGSADVRILGVNGGNETNDTSIILKVEYGETSFLFTGDAEREAENAVLNSGMDVSATLLKVGHHGSDTSTSYVWLNEIMPEYAIISVGEGNSYEHPTELVLSRLRDAGVETYRTDLNGDIYVTSDGKEVTITTDRVAAEQDIFKGADSGKSLVTESVTLGEVSGGVTYVINTKTGKFHYPTCSSAQQIDEDNCMEYTGIRSDLIEMGYASCRRCDA